MITKRVGRWVDSRLHAAKFVRHAMNHVFPDHWSFMLGEIALYSFMVLVVTGTYLALFFHASSAEVVYHGPYPALQGVKMSVAYRSVLDICFSVPGGLMVRQMHHWAALIFLWAIVAHMARIFFTAAYRRPREINWVIGLTMALLALANGFFGYSILDDLLSGTGLRVGYAIMLSVPLVGPWLTYLFMGGDVPNPLTLPRLYSLHIFVVPALIATLLALHLGIIWRQKHTNYPGPRRTNHTIVGSRLWPTYTAKSLGLLFLVFAVVAGLGGLAQIDPVWLYGPYDPAKVLTGAQPDWYMGWIEGAMRLSPGVNVWIGRWLIPEVFFPAVLMPTLVFGGLYLYPFVEQLLSGEEGNQNVLRLPRYQPVNSAIGGALFIFMGILLLAGGDDVLAVLTNSSVVEIRAVLRVLVILVPLLTAGVVYALCDRARRRDAALLAVAEDRERIAEEEYVAEVPEPSAEDATEAVTPVQRLQES